MIINIPTDVVLIIFSYLYFDTGFSNVVFTSKNFNKIINASIEIKKYKLFLESINMLKNDKTYEKNYDNLNLLWEKYHNFRWKSTRAWNRMENCSAKHCFRYSNPIINLKVCRGN